MKKKFKAKRRDFEKWVLMGFGVLMEGVKGFYNYGRKKKERGEREKGERNMRVLVFGDEGS